MTSTSPLCGCVYGMRLCRSIKANANGASKGGYMSRLPRRTAVIRVTRCNTGCPYIDDYLNPILDGTDLASIEVRQAAEYVPKKLSGPDVLIDTAATEKAVELIERYFGYKLLPWELFVLALVHCFYRSNDTVVFSEFLIMMGRGNGKNGFISGLVWYLTTHYHGVDGYNVDIIANSEDQAKTSFDDVYEMLERTWAKSKRFFYKSKEIIKNLNTGSYIKYNTSNARTKDGKRSACLIFDEIHEYENSASIQVFRSGFGMEKAKALIAASPDMSFGTVGETVGYEDQHYFSRLFRLSTGMSPSEYRDTVKRAEPRV